MTNTTNNNNDNTNTSQPQENATKNSAQKPGAGTLSTPTQKLQAPTNMSVDIYLSQYIATVNAPAFAQMNKIQYAASLIEIGAGALAAKIADVENYNLAMKSGKKRLPDGLSFEDVAVLMLSLYTFKNVQMTGRPDDVILAMYDAQRGTYETKQRGLLWIMERLAPKFKERDIEDVLHKIGRVVDSVKQTEDRNLFAVGNGIYNKATKTLQPFDPAYVFLTKIQVPYVKNAPNPIVTMPDGIKWDVESWIADIMNDDPDCVTLIWQVISDCIQPHYSHGKSIWFYSEKGNNGKGTIGQLIKNLLGEGNYSGLSVADFNHEFLKETLVGVSANISDENDVDAYVDSVKDYKSSVTGDDINVNRKYEKPIRIKFKSTNIQMMNGLPKTKDKSESWYRRLILVPFMKSFTNNGERKYIKDKYIEQQDVLQYVLFKALTLDFHEYITPAVSSALLDSYKEKNNPVLEFWKDIKGSLVWDFLPTPFLYDVFLKWYKMNNPVDSKMSSRSFIENLINVIQVDGDEWEDHTKKNKRTTQTTIHLDEPLITEYNLDKKDRNGDDTKWMAKDFSGTNPEKRREFKRNDFYRGFAKR